MLGNKSPNKFYNKIYEKKTWKNLCKKSMKIFSKKSLKTFSKKFSNHFPKISQNIMKKIYQKFSKKSSQIAFLNFVNVFWIFLSKIQGSWSKSSWRHDRRSQSQLAGLEQGERERTEVLVFENRAFFPDTSILTKLFFWLL